MAAFYINSVLFHLLHCTQRRCVCRCWFCRRFIKKLKEKKTNKISSQAFSLITRIVVINTTQQIYCNSKKKKLK